MICNVNVGILITPIAHENLAVHNCSKSTFFHFFMWLYLDQLVHKISYCATLGPVGEANPDSAG